LHEALKAQLEMDAQGIYTQVIDLYSIKPINYEKLRLAITSDNIILVEDHFPEGGLGEAVISGLANYNYHFKHLAVTNQPMSGKPEELLAYENIDSNAICNEVKSGLL
jgi:transketolase